MSKINPMTRMLYVGIDKKTKEIMAMSIDSPPRTEKDLASDIAMMIRNGCTVRYVSSAWYRKNDHRWKK